MPLYENSVIYKLVHKNDQDNENIYVGSTTNFRGRKLQHKKSTYNPNEEKYNRPQYKYIRENGGWDEWEMIAIETYPCESKRELEIRERYHIETLKPKLNKNIPTRTMKEYCEDNKELISEKRKKYRQNIHTEILERKKKYRQDNRDKILEKQKEIITCECGLTSTRSSISRHRNTDKHKKKMEELNN
jgi:hypothetical protein